MLVRHVALVSDVKDVSPRDLTRVGAAIQKQVSRDFAPIWEVSSNISTFAHLDDVPIDYWPVVLVRNAQNKAGVHLDTQGQPFALVEFTDGWSMAASHETLEMLVDPFGKRLVAGESPKEGQGRVEFLVEVCDPSGAGDFGYTVNGVRVSDFYSPHYFDPVPAAGVRYSFTGAITAPREVLKGGYLSWHDVVSDEWFQLRFFGTAREIVRLDGMSGAGADVRSSLRSLIDTKTPAARAAVRFASLDHQSRFSTADEMSRKASRAKAETLRNQIDALIPGRRDDGQ